MTMEPIPLTEADSENLKATNIMLTMARHRPAHKREPFYKAAGEHLMRLRHGKGVEIWAELIRTHLGIGLSRAYELVALGMGKRLVDLRAEKGAPKRRWKGASLPNKPIDPNKSEA